MITDVFDELSVFTTLGTQKTLESSTDFTYFRLSSVRSMQICEIRVGAKRGFTKSASNSHGSEKNAFFDP